MSNTNQARIQEVLLDGYEFKFGEYFSRGFEIFQKNIGLFVGYTFLVFLIQMVWQLLPFIGIVGQVIMTYPLTVGFYLYAFRSNTTENPDFAEFFKGFDHFGPLVAQYGLVILGMIVICLPLIVMAVISMDSGFLMDDYGDPSFMFFPVLLVFLIPIIYLSVAWTWGPMLTIFFGLGAWDALETSRKIISRQWWIFFGFIFVVGLLSMAGIIGLIVGVLFTYPMGMCIQYAAFEDIMQLRYAAERSGEDDIVDHFIG